MTKKRSKDCFCKGRNEGWKYHSKYACATYMDKSKLKKLSENELELAGDTTIEAWIIDGVSADGSFKLYIDGELFPTKGKWVHVGITYENK